jgi:protein tyrosine phosphatase (PTP) superfamily phosphohydrolase (DUF442 family)
MKNEARIGLFTVAGQPTNEEITGLRERGFGTVINVRMPDEQPEPEEPVVTAAGLRYAAVPFTGTALSEEHVRRVREAVDAAGGEPVLLH